MTKHTGSARAKAQQVMQTTTIELPKVGFEKMLSAKQIAAEFGVNEDTVLCWWHQGLPTGTEIPRPYMKRRGFREYLFHPQILDWLRAEQDKLD